jgi:PPOX class probable F420-dependent enzyme
MQQCQGLSLLMANWRGEYRDFINACRIARLSTVDASGEPYLVPICYALVDGTIVTPIDEKPKRTDRPLKRVRNIEETGRAAVLFDHYEDTDWSNLRWLMLRGTATVIGPDDDMHQLAIRALRARYAQYAAMNLENAKIIAVMPEHISAWGFADL